MNTEPRDVGTTEPDGLPEEDPGLRAAMDAYMEVSAGDQTGRHVKEDDSDALSDALEESGQNLDELAAALTAAVAEAEEHRNQVLRVRADMENLKRRHAAELEKAHKYALDSFVRELLQVRDSLELGRSAAMEGADIDTLREGTDLTLKLLGDVMDKFGVVKLDPINQPFDPEFHQAMSIQPRADVPPNTVVGVIQKGYTLNGRLVRPALVLVSQQSS